MFARSLLLVALVACRGTGRGMFVAIEPRPDAELTAAGSRVAIVDDRAAAGCRHVGYVTGVATKRGIRLADQDHAQLVGTLSREGAIADARNRAAGHADAIAIDADETWESGRAVRYLVHGRALVCHSAK